MKTLTKNIITTMALALAANVYAVPSGPQLPSGVNCTAAELTTSISCVGVYDPGSDHGQASIFDDATFISAYGTGWTSLSKVEDPSWGTGALGLTLTGQGAKSGTWSVDSDAWDAYAQGDILAILKAGNDAAAYELDLTVTAGTWDVSTSSWAAGDDKTSALSHFSFWTKGASNPPQVSEPGTLALLGFGILGLYSIRKKSPKV